VSDGRLPPGTRLGPYEVIDHVGGGGQAEVYRARDVRLGREVAIKILPEELAADRDALARFEREARTASALNHPHLVTIYDIGEATVDGKTLRFIAMELIRGTTLRRRLHHDLDSLLPQFADVADALAAAHDAGIIHRDLKPENVMVSTDGFVKVVDFGLAKEVAADVPGAHVTADGLVVGTVSYMAPEQVTGRRDLDARVDIFALGCMLYEAVAKRPPFDGESAVDVMHEILHGEPPPLDSPALERIVRRCLAKDREQRFRSMRDVARAIRGMDEVTAVRTPAPAPRRRPRAALALVVVVLSVAGYVGYRHVRRLPIGSIAVVPFVNATGDMNLDLLSEGLADGVAHELSRSAGLRVIATSSMNRYRGGADRQQVARELHVDAVLIGTLQSNRGLKLDVALVDGASNHVAWTKEFPVAWPEARQLEYEIAEAVRDKTTGDGTLRPLRQTPNRQAYEAYQNGQRQLRFQTAPALQLAIAYFHQAIDLDPGYARAYVGLATAHGRQAVYGIVPNRAANEQELAELHKAVALDDSLPDAHFELAMVASSRHDQAEYQRQLARTLELDPNFAPAHLERAKQFLFRGKFAEADEAYQRARSLDPMSPGIPSSYAVHLLLVRQYEHSRSILFNLTQQFPDYPNATAYLAVAYSYLGRHDDALAAIEQAKPSNNPNVLVWKGIMLARAGRAGDAKRIANVADDLARSRFLPNYYRAQLRANLGERETALSMLERGKAAGEWQLAWLPYDPGFDPLREDPRFKALLR